MCAASGWMPGAPWWEGIADPTVLLLLGAAAVYGVAGDAMLKEDAAFHPITAYGESKVLVERDVAGVVAAAHARAPHPHRPPARRRRWR